MGAGGTRGGELQFFLGIGMMCGGFYMLFNSMIVNARFGLGARLYSFNAFGGQYGVTGGMILIPFLIGVGFIFYNRRNMLGWVLAIGSLVAMLFGVLSTLSISFRTMTAFELITILVLAFGGLGLFLNALRPHPAED